VPFNGRTLIIGNHFEDANWVNAGYGTSIDVVCAQNQLLRCADMMNYGVRSDGWFEPSWQVQYFDNSITQGQTKVGSNGDDGHRSPLFAGPLTCWAVHRRQSIAADNSGSIVIGGNIVDAVVEGCVLRHALSAISIDGLPRACSVAPMPSRGRHHLITSVMEQQGRWWTSTWTSPQGSPNPLPASRCSALTARSAAMMAPAAGH
jgi:hypothetical protein